MMMPSHSANSSPRSVRPAHAPKLTAIPVATAMVKRRRRDGRLRSFTFCSFVRACPCLSALPNNALRFGPRHLLNISHPFRRQPVLILAFIVKMTRRESRLQSLLVSVPHFLLVSVPHFRRLGVRAEDWACAPKIGRAPRKQGTRAEDLGVRAEDRTCAGWRGRVRKRRGRERKRRLFHARTYFSVPVPRFPAAEHHCSEAEQ
jgi:hypothetical protein